MPLASPKLDDRTFDDLMREAQSRLRRSCPEWTDASASDPGTVLLELFAALTDNLLYRLNRVPDKLYVEFLRLMGVYLVPPSAARVRLVFSCTKASADEIRIPLGTGVTLARAEPGREAPVFVTLRHAAIAAGAREIAVEAMHCTLVDGEDAGVSTGAAGQALVAKRAPIIAASGDEGDLVVGVEAAPEEIPAGETALVWNGATYRRWREVDDFTGHGAHAPVYIADRASGRILFAPAARLRDGDRLADASNALAGVPAAGRGIRLWYRAGGGIAGNIGAGRLTVLKDPLPGVTVTNPQAATGGAALETVDNALVRGPLEFYSLRRAVTAFDYELIAAKQGAVARAKAWTRASLYRHAAPGTVEVLLVPRLPASHKAGDAVTADLLAASASEDARLAVQRTIDERRPLGTTCVVGWARTKTVRVKARVVVGGQADPEAVRADVAAALHRRLSPVPVDGTDGWRFGEALRASSLYELILARPHVAYVDNLRLVTDQVPDQRVAAVAADPFQPSTWYAATGEQLFASEDDGEGWQLAATFAGDRLAVVRPHPKRPGLLAIASFAGEGAKVRVSRDGGMTWREFARTAFKIADLAWTTRDDAPALLIAADVGLFELALGEGATPVQVPVVAEQPDLGFFAVTVLPGRGVVAVAAEKLGGVHLSHQGGAAGSFHPFGLANEDVRVLGFLVDGPRAFLWAGLAAVGNENGKGCLSREIRSEDTGTDGWRWSNKGWNAGSVRGLAFQGSVVVAASHRGGVLTIDSAANDAAWTAISPVDGGLPLRDAGRLQLQPVDSIASDPAGERLMVGGIQGVYRTTADAMHFACCSCAEFSERVTLPATALFAEGEHEITVVADDEDG